MNYVSRACILGLLVLIGTQSNALAAQASKQETVGVGTGAIVGAVAGGPVGFIIGAAVGAKIGDSFHQKGEQLEELQLSLTRSEREAQRLASNVVDLNDEVNELHRVARPELLALLQAGIDMELLFRTDEFVMTATTSDRLQRLAQSISGMPEVRVQLDGFADERGAADYNLALSERRVDAVRDLFIAAGVDPTRIASSAHGETAADTPTVDNFALQRRVSVKLYIEGEAVAAN